MYINLASRPDRRAFMEKQFATFGIDADRIEAKTPADVLPTLAEPARSTVGKPRLGPAEIACTFSHFDAWQRAIASGADACVVFEDDGVLSRRLSEFLEELGASLPPGIDLIKIETAGKPVRLDRIAIGMAEFKLQRLTSSHFGCCGYVISTRLAAELMATMPFQTLPIDDCLFARDGGKRYTTAYQLLPALAFQLVVQRTGKTTEAARSDIAATRAQRSTGKRRDLPRLSRVRINLLTAWANFRAYGLGAVNPKAHVPFAGDDLSS